MRVRGLTDTKEGRLLVIGVVGGTLMIGAALGNLALADAADSTADDVRARLRRDLAAVTDEAIDAYPATAGTIEAAAAEAVRGEPVRVLGSAERGGEVVVAVQAGWGWQVRCIEAELRGDATVLTYVRSQRC
ncbi:MAG TPA: hypothetical protein VFZ77_21430 [Acidimicrobiales bacterium]